MGIRLLRNLVAVRPSKDQEVSRGGIHLAKAQTQLRGTVVAVGPGMHTEKGEFVEMVVQKGDTVAFSKQTRETADKFEIDSEELLIFPEDAVIAIIER